MMFQFNRSKLLVFVLIFIVSMVGPLYGLSPENIAVLRESVFEVVVPRLEKDFVTYKKKLPFHNLTFKERTDPYLSIGSAFTVGDNAYITAAHVLSLEGKTQHPATFIRDASGATYKIKDILDYSYSKDFVKFSVENNPESLPLPLNTRPSLDSKVYAIGNALGEGVVTREGLLVSRTPEDVNGDWNWIRFSAPASPGNSGGPLIDDQGRVLGVVLRKSSNENLNHALPIDQTLSESPSEATYSTSSAYYYIPNQNFKLDYELTITNNVPLAIDEFRKRLTTQIIHSDKGYLNQHILRSKNSDSHFPGSSKASTLIFDTVLAPVPLLARQLPNDVWTVDGSRYRAIDIDSEGQSILFQFEDDDVAMFLEKGDKVSLSSLLSDSKYFMDTLLKTGLLYREIGLEKISITSLGAAIKTGRYTDRYGRKWLLNWWHIPFDDDTLFTAALPTPAGLSIFSSREPTRLDFYDNTTKEMLNYIFQDYRGTYEEWEAFLALKEYVPPFFDSFSVSKSKKAITAGTSSFNITMKSPYYTHKDDYEIYVHTNFRKVSDSFVLDIRLLSVFDEYREETVSLIRYDEPRADSVKEIRKIWRSIEKEKYPFNGDIHQSEGGTSLFVVQPMSKEDESALIYQLISSGKKNREEMMGRYHSVIEAKGN